MLVLEGVRKYVAYLRSAQGSRGATTTWARVAELVMRLTQSLFLDRASLMCYVDDPLGAIKGTVAQRRQVGATSIHVWSALGLPLSLDKASLVRRWSGSEVCSRLTTWETASIKLSLVDDINTALDELVGGNLISLKKLHSFVGKVNNVASLLVVLRPFLHPLWAALYSPESGSPKGTVWTNQVLPV